MYLNKVHSEPPFNIYSAVGKRVGLGNFERAGWGFNPHCGQKVESGKSECNNSGYKLTGPGGRDGLGRC